MNNRICNQLEKQRINSTGIRKTSVVVLVTLITMVTEIVYGLITGSMALLADGIHMGTHTFALLVTLAAYYIAHKNADNPNFAFSSGKVGVLGGYTNAILLGLTAFYMIYEAVYRLINPETIIFNQALLVAAVGLSVNLVSARLLSSKGGKNEGHGHGHDHGHSHGHHDHNLRSAYIHVITDAMTSVLAIAALLAGKFFNQTWPDSVVAILGAAVILKWAFDLLKSSGSLLVDYHSTAEDREKVLAIADEFGQDVTDLHIWQTSENQKTIIINISPLKQINLRDFEHRIRHECLCQHLTVAQSG